MGKRADATKQLLENAAREELISSGIAKFSIESVANRARMNKALVYRYLGNREETLEAAFASILTERMDTLAAQPANLQEGIQHWITANAAQPNFFKLLAEEALSGEATIMKEEREEYYQKQIAATAKLIPTDDPTMTFAALLALTAFPFLAPTVFQLITQSTPNPLPRYTSAINNLIT